MGFTDRSERETNLRGGGSASLRLTAEQVRFFDTEGYLSVPAISTPAEIEKLIRAYDAMFEQRLGFDAGDFFDFAGPDDSRPEIPQILMPYKYDPVFHETRIFASCESMARQLLGPKAVFVFDHLITKAANGRETPWHQDQAFCPAGTRYRSITFWIPLQPVDRDRGCLKFLPRSKDHGLYRHRSLDGDRRIHALEALDVDDRNAVHCPLPAGGATIHPLLTLHGADANLTQIPRRAYACAFGVHGDPDPAEAYPWNREKTLARDARRRAFGFSGRLKREIRRRLARAGII